jgi:hypothetical protein
MKKSSTKLTPVVTRVKDTTPELDDVRSIVLQNRETPTPYDLSLIEGMASHLIPSEEICSIIRISKGRFEKNMEMQAAYQRGIDLGKSTLRRMMWVTAKTQPVMQIWLSKQHLGMADKVERVEGESQHDAYKGFLDKLNIVINLPATGNAPPQVVGAGTGNSDILLETVGTDSPAPTEPRTVDGAGENDQVDRGVAASPPRQNLHRLVEDMVISGG